MQRGNLPQKSIPFDPLHSKRASSERIFSTSAHWPALIVLVGRFLVTIIGWIGDRRELIFFFSPHTCFPRCFTSVRRLFCDSSSLSKTWFAIIHRRKNERVERQQDFRGT